MTPRQGLFSCPKGKPMSVTEFLNVHEAAAELRVSVNTLRLWRSNDRGPESFAIGGRVYYEPTAIEQWIDAQMATTSRGGV
jgi:predicted DNA-binding transcriptional regulator AlpA